MTVRRHCEPEGRSNLLAVAALLVTACTPEQPVDESPAAPVVVYAAVRDDSAFAEQFDRFREATGIVVVHRHGESTAIVGDIVRNDIAPPADVLVTRSAVDAWRAAEEGALRPVYSDKVDRRVPSWARDSDRLWFAFAADPAVVAYAGDDLPAREWADLADERYSGALCLSSARHEVNRAVLSVLVATAGTRAAELAVRGWIDNLATGPFDSEEELAAAIADGRCGVGILSQGVAMRANGLRYRLLAPGIATVDAIGVGRHARNEPGAQAFVEWLVDEMPAIGTGDVVPQDASVPAQYDEEARKLAERARYY